MVYVVVFIEIDGHDPLKLCIATTTDCEKKMKLIWKNKRENFEKNICFINSVLHYDTASSKTLYPIIELPSEGKSIMYYYKDNLNSFHGC